MSQSKAKQTPGREMLAKSSDAVLRDFNRSLPMSLLKAREAVMRQFVTSLKEHGLSPQQWRAIRSLEQEDGLEISELSKRCYLLPPSMSRIAQNLESRKLVERRAVESDQRRAALYLTAKGRTLFAEIAPKSAERYANITARFGYGKLELLYELLDDLVSCLEDK